MRVGGKVWRDQLREWLAFLGGLKGAKGLFRWREVQRAVALQLMDLDPGVQQAALRSLKVRSDQGLRSGLSGSPIRAIRAVEGGIAWFALTAVGVGPNRRHEAHASVFKHNTTLHVIAMYAWREGMPPYP